MTLVSICVRVWKESDNVAVGENDLDNDSPRPESDDLKWWKVHKSKRAIANGCLT